MKITESNLRKIITEEVEKIIAEEDYPVQEDLLQALEVISEAPASALKENLQLLQILVNRAKNSWHFDLYAVSYIRKAGD